MDRGVLREALVERPAALVENVGLDTLSSILCRQLALLLLQHRRRLHQVLLIVLLADEIQIALLLVLILVLIGNNGNARIYDYGFPGHLLLKVDVVDGVFQAVVFCGAFRGHA